MKSAGRKPKAEKEKQANLPKPQKQEKKSKGGNTIYFWDNDNIKHKPNEIKENLIEIFAEVLAELPNSAQVTITNKNNQVDFKIGDKEFYIKLVQTGRKKKSKE